MQKKDFNLISKETPTNSRSKYEFLCVLLVYQNFYIKMTCALTSLVLGPWIGMGLISANASNVPWLEMLTLCFLLYIVSTVLPMVPESLVPLIIWDFFYFVMVLGHWIIYFTHEVNKEHPESLIKMKGVFVGFTMVYAVAIFPPVNYIIYKRLSKMKYRYFNTEQEI